MLRQNLMEVDRQIGAIKRTKSTRLKMRIPTGFGYCMEERATQAVDPP